VSTLEFRNPLSGLPETARSLVLSAKAIVAERGFAALTLNRLAAESGENKAMVAYYFGNKAGLVAAVLDSVIHDEYLSSKDRMKDVGVEGRALWIAAEMRRLDAASAEFRVFFELLPHVLRSDVLRRRIALLYRWYWDVKLEWLGFEGGVDALDDPDVLGLAQLLSAVIDGLAIQAAIDPDLDLEGPYRVLATLLEGALPALAGGGLAEAQETV